uniref:Gamma-glutamyltransferase n=1 Tax=Schistocephalus solidus TaxID=70667 RepID=A0A183SCF6_SCHSO
LGDDEAVICPTIGIADRLGYQHALSISPPDENIVQQMPAPRPRVHTRGDDEAVICPTIGIVDHLGYQHVLSTLPLDEKIFQQMPAPQPNMHPRELLPRRKAEEGVCQQETVFRTRTQMKGAGIVLATVTVGTQHSLPGSVVRPDAGVEVIKDN